MFTFFIYILMDEADTHLFKRATFKLITSKKRPISVKFNL